LFIKKSGGFFREPPNSLQGLPEGNNFLRGREATNNGAIVKGSVTLSINIIDGLDASVASWRRVASIACRDVAKANKSHGALASVSLSESTSVYSSVDCSVIHNILLLFIDYEIF